jgi:isoleucyl-tRNA synthetase
VFDCWFESESMPFAQCHYPFLIDEEAFSKKVSSKYYCRGLDQTRVWFYTLMVISSAVMGKELCKNIESNLKEIIKANNSTL